MMRFARSAFTRAAAIVASSAATATVASTAGGGGGSSSSPIFVPAVSAAFYAQHPTRNRFLASSQQPSRVFSSGSNDDGNNDTVMPDAGDAADETAKARAAAKAGYGADAPTIFDKLMDGSIPANVVYEDETTFCFRDVNPQAPTHILCIPKKKDGLYGISAMREDQEGIVGHLMYVASQVARKECPDGFRLVINDGGDGGQSVSHLHVHILGGRQMKWPPG